MLTTIYAHDIMNIVNAAHRSPHYILGQHEAEVIVKGERTTVLTVRAFFPDAKRVVVIDAKNPARTWEMDKVHDGGMFEAILWDVKERIQYRLRVESAYGHEWEQDDPYAGWVEGITQFDRYLFNRSQHYKLYEKLGAHLMERDGKKGTFFSVWAPNAQRVSVIGNFNGWDGRRDAMELLADAGVWVLFKPGIGEGEVYKFEIKARDGRLLEKADPYATYAEMRPKTASVVYTLEEYAWTDDAWIERRANVDFLAQPVSIYEVHLGSWRRKPEEDNRFLTYREFADELIPYVKDMGFTHIELMPVEEHPFDGSWGYQVCGYFAPTSRFGTPRDLQYFIDRCHNEGIGVLLDWVPAHFPKDAHGLAEFDGSCLYEHADPRQGEHPEWGTKIFNFGRSEVKNFLISNALYWLDKFHFDGLRVDAVASMLYLDYSKKDGEWVPNQFGGRENLEAVEFIQHLNSVVYQYFPGVMMGAEESTSWPNVSRPTYTGGLGFGYKWNMGWMHDVLEYAEHEPIHRRYHHGQLTFGLLYAWTENFILPFSHDEVTHGKGSMINKMPGDYWQKFANLRVLYSFMWTHPGKQLLFMGQEFGQFDEWNAERSLDWHLLDFDFHRGMKQCVTDLNRVYRENPALWQKDFVSEGFRGINCDDSDNSVLSYIRYGHEQSEHVLVVLNFTPVPRHGYVLGVPELTYYEEIFNSDAGQYCGSNTGNGGGAFAEPGHAFGFEQRVTITVPPLAGLIFRPKREGQPERKPVAAIEAAPADVAKGETPAASPKKPRVKKA